MMVLFLHDVPGKGKQGEVKDVKSGFFKNFLLPKKLAKAVTPEVLENLEKEKARLEAQGEKLRDHFLKILQEVSGLALQTTLKEGAGGKAFGSVTAQKIVEILKQKGFEIKKSSIDLPEPIKTFGFHDVKLDFGHGVSGIVRIEVIPER